MKNQALYSSKDKSKILKCHLLQILFGALRVSHRQDKKNYPQHSSYVHLGDHFCCEEESNYQIKTKCDVF